MPPAAYRIGVMQELFGTSLGGRSRRARDDDDDELDLQGYTTGTHEPRKRPIRTNADSHTEAREFGTPVDCQRRSTTADAPSGGGSAGSNPVGGTVGGTQLQSDMDGTNWSAPSRTFPILDPSHWRCARPTNGLSGMTATEDLSNRIV